MRMARQPIAATMMIALMRKSAMSSQKCIRGSVHDWLWEARVIRQVGKCETSHQAAGQTDTKAPTDRSVRLCLWVARLDVEPFDQRLDDWPLSLVYLLQSLVDRKPAGFVDLGEFRHPPGPRRPFERKGIAPERGGIEVLLASEAFDR